MVDWKRVAIAITATSLLACGAEIGPAPDPIAKQPLINGNPIDEFGGDVLDGEGLVNPPPVPCSDGVTHGMMADGTCYFTFTSPLTWTAARTACKIYQADLATIDSGQENIMVHALANSAGITVPDYWIGANDRTTEGLFKWLNETSLITFSKWRAGEPNNGNGTNEDCAVIEADNPNREWDDRLCSMAKPYVCEQFVAATNGTVVITPSEQPTVSPTQ